ncbi:MAG TPA: glycogen debranching N-terminal domain-containing protein [Ornithinibacter sp.]|nr:glycogen debranching N-terminal domain-containing protein [Ornithinibacter sp.]
MSAAEPAPPVRSRQPWLHELEVAVHGNVTCLSHRSGDLDAGTEGGAATGLYVDDRRVLDLLSLTVDGVAPVPVVAATAGPSTECLLLARNVGDPGPDPTVEVRRHRVLRDTGMTETVTVTSRAGTEVRCGVLLRARGDGAELHTVKSGLPAGPPLPAVTSGPERGGWADSRHTTTVVAHDGTVSVEAGTLCARWAVAIPPGASATLVLEVTARRAAPTPFDAGPGAALVDWDAVHVTSQDSRLSATVHRSLVDLRHLLLTDPLDEGDVFAAAGSPWYLTLFGRDSIWAARMSLPFGTELAKGTLRALARRQGTHSDVASAQQPGKILHEVRRTVFQDPGNFTLPPTYYGTVDATPLWVCLLHDAWRWGLAPQDVRALHPALTGALGWMRRTAADADGLLRYHDASGTGLSNQGWKDSGDAMRTASGSIAVGPIALVETQAYAVEAALGGADLLEAVLGEDGAPWRAWALDLADRVRGRFWVDAPAGPRLAMALDGEGRVVDGVGSNMGHALGTGLLRPDESARVAATLGAPEMLGPLGIRTLSADNPAYNPLGYHTGSVWTHDTAICAHGLARSGHPHEAGRAVAALVDVAAASGYRWPELFGAEPVGGRPAPYPASCRPQAWAAASAGLIVSTVLGLRADAPNGRLVLSPLPDPPCGALRVEGLRVSGLPVTVEVSSTGQVVAVDAPDGLEVVAATPHA